jgi:large subunit ribosomal protein L18
MNRLTSKLNNSLRRQNRVRTVVRGTTERPRLSVKISNLHVSAQIIDDSTSKTLVSSSTVSLKAKGTMTEKATSVGQDIAKKAKAKKIKAVAFDRGPKLYHGRVKALADAARKEGLEF